jgi:cardiolipin synthase
VGRLIEDIDGAEEHVHLLFYIIACDRTGTRVVEALERAAGRGVECRVLADAVGSRAFHRKLAGRLGEAGVDVRKVLPLDRLLRRLRPLDLRNHRKLAVIDGRVAYTGSMNLVDYDEVSGTEYAPWRDVLVRVEGPAVLQLQLVFLEDWRYNTDEDLTEGVELWPPDQAGDVALQVVPSGPTEHVETVHGLLVAAINAARERVVITTPYFIPDEPTRVALRLATLRGVEVDVVVPSVSDSRFVTAAGQSYYREFLDEGVRILAHRDGFLHAKTITIDDDFAVVGSVNFDRRSFYLNFELALLLYGDEAVGQIAALQEGYMDGSDRIESERWAGRGMMRKVTEDVARLLSPLL